MGSSVNATNGVGSINGMAGAGGGVSLVNHDDTKTLYDLYEKIDNENSIEIEKLGGHLERALAYDAVWVMAYSLNHTLQKYKISSSFFVF